MNEPTLVYFAYKFSCDPTENTEKARLMSIELMKNHPDWIVICPHYTIDALFDGCVNWDEKKIDVENLPVWKRGYMGIGILSRCDIMVLGCPPTYKESAGVTWEFIFAKLLNDSWRKNNPIKIMTYEDAIDNGKGRTT